MYHSITIGEKNTWDDWHLVPSSRPVVNPPEVDQNIVRIPRRNGFTDLSEMLMSQPIYQARTGSWEFIAHPDYADKEPWDAKFSAIMQYLHNQSHGPIILEDDRAYYYQGRLKVSEWTSGDNWSTIKIDYILYPFKIEVQTASQDWLWDPFDFVTGIIRNYKNLTVNGTLKLEIKMGARPISPTFTTSSDMTLTFKTETYSLPAGSTQNNEIMLMPGDNVLVFSGYGTVTIFFSAGWL